MFMVGLVLALSVPSIALAVNTASFKTPVPASGSWIRVANPTISLFGYDRYGVKASGISMWVGGRRVTPTFTYNNLGRKSFRLTYAVPAALPNGAVRVTVKVKDLRGKLSSTSWLFNVDTIAPVTVASGALPGYPGLGAVSLAATDGGSGVTHTYWTLDNGTAWEGAILVTLDVGSHHVDYWSVDKAGNVETPKTLSTVVTMSHALPTLGSDTPCLAAGCHDSPDIASVHGASGCLRCHGGLVAPTNDCQVCHGASNPPPHHAVHEPILSSGTPACTQDACHGSALMGPHTSCATCHQSTVPKVVAAIAAGGASCESCHDTYASTHTSANPSHLVSGSCFTSTCHGTDVTRMHTIDFRGTGALPPGCAACHGAGKTPSTECGSCHEDLLAPHNDVAAHARVQPLLATNSTACVACHGSVIMQVLPVDATSGFTEHKGCSCHAYAEARAKTSCEGCHTGAHAAHSFDLSASGHSTPNYGKKGVYTKFDGTQGVLLKDTFENTVTTTWGFPEVNVFWSANDTSAPSSAIKGLTKDSIVTCQDCHTGLSAAGPHGAAQNWGIDPNYPGAYKYAVLGARKGNTEDTSTSGIKFRTSMSDAPGYTGPTADATTGLLPSRNVGNDPREIADGTKGEHAVICAKCHDLFNEGTGCDGWSNAYGDVDPGVESIHGMHAGGLSTETSATRLAQRGGNQGRTDGRSDCVNCHVAIPHGWSRPRLLVNGYTGSYPTSTTAFVGELESVADPFPYWQGRGQQMAPGVSPGNGPLAATEEHTLNSQGVPIWDEQMCISCSGGLNEGELEHGNREPQISNPAKLK